MSARLDSERGAVVESAVAQVAAAEGISATDALVRIAEIGLAALNRRAEGTPRGLRGHERAAVLIHLDVTALPVAENIDAATATEPVAEALPRSPERGTGLNADRPDRLFARIAHGPGLPRSVVERRLCACRVRVRCWTATATTSTSDGRNAPSTIGCSAPR